MLPRDSSQNTEKKQSNFQLIHKLIESQRKLFFCRKALYVIYKIGVHKFDGVYLYNVYAIF